MWTIRIFLICIFHLNGFCQPPSIDWQKCYGGSFSESGHVIKATNDGGYLIGCATNSNDGDVSGLHGSGLIDYWVVKIDSGGSIIWQKCYGGTQEEFITNIEKTNDGFMISGTTGSNDGDVSGWHSSGDEWIVHCDNLGQILWQKCYGGSNSELKNKIILDINGGYSILGTSNSSDFDVVGSHTNSTCIGCGDAWYKRIDTTGTIIFSKCLGGTWSELGSSILQLEDSSYLIVGATRSNDGDVSGLHGLPDGDFDIWLVRLSITGQIIMQQCLGGYWLEEAFDVIQTFDNGFLIVGYTTSIDSFVIGNHGYYDCWVVKVDSSLNIEWQKCLGGTSAEFASSALQVSDSGFVILAHTNSVNGDVTNNHSLLSDVWLIKLDPLGNIIWTQCYGGSLEDQAADIIQTSDGGLIFCGSTESNDGDVSGNHGYFDVWVVKLSPLPDGISSPQHTITDITTHLNQSTNTLTLNFYANRNEKGQLQLLDITGRKLLQQGYAVTEGLNKKEVRTIELPGGVYIVRMVTEGGSISKKVIVH